MLFANNTANRLSNHAWGIHPRRISNERCECEKSIMFAQKRKVSQNAKIAIHSIIVYAALALTMG